MTAGSVKEIICHDAYIRSLRYSRGERSVRLLVKGYLMPQAKVVEAEVGFREVGLFLCSDTWPWGHSNSILEAAWVDRSPLLFDCVEFEDDTTFLHIKMQSGDDVWIGYRDVVVECEDA